MTHAIIGALLAGWDDVTGIEREAEYAAIARARAAWKREGARKPVLAVIDQANGVPVQRALFEEAQP